MSVDRCQPVTITNIESSEWKVQHLWRIVQITEWSSKHTDSMERNHAWRWSFISLPFHWVNLKLNQIVYLGVPGEAQHDLVQHIFKHKVLVVVGSSQLDVFENQFINYVIGVENTTFQLLPVLKVIGVQMASKNKWPNLSSVQRWGISFLQYELTEGWVFVLDNQLALRCHRKGCCAVGAKEVVVVSSLEIYSVYYYILLSNTYTYIVN